MHVPNLWGGTHRQLFPSIRRAFWLGSFVRWWKFQSFLFLFHSPTTYFRNIVEASLKEFRSRVPKKGSVCVHIRHGLKHLEMKLLPFSHYLAVADSLRSNHSHVQTMFLTTDSNEVVAEADALARTGRWSVVIPDLVREPVVEKHKDPFMSGTPGVRMHSWKALYLHSLCEFQICTFASNWCQALFYIRSQYHDPDTYIEAGPYVVPPPATVDDLVGRGHRLPSDMPPWFPLSLSSKASAPGPVYQPI